ALFQPGCEEALDLPAAPRALEAGPHELVLDDDEGRHRRDPETLHEVGPFPLVDPVELEGAVVSAALEHLREEPLDAAARAGHGRVEEDETWLLSRRGDGGHLGLLRCG